MHDVTVLTTREVTAVAWPIPSVVLDHIHRREDDPSRTVVMVDEDPVGTGKFLADFDLVVNCVLQDTDAPMLFVDDDDLASFTPGSILVDVSCDLGMGFSVARPTTFEEPTFLVGDGVTYYGVDHSPAYLWNSATWGISEALFGPLSDGQPSMGAGAVTMACEAPTGAVADNTDYDDRQASAFPGNTERCDGVDNDCDGTTDAGATDASAWYNDGDADGFGAGEATLACQAPAGAVAQDGDCDDDDAAYNPAASETDCADPNDSPNHHTHTPIAEPSPGLAG